MADRRALKPTLRVSRRKLSWCFDAAESTGGQSHLASGLMASGRRVLERLDVEAGSLDTHAMQATVVGLAIAVLADIDDRVLTAISGRASMASW